MMIAAMEIKKLFRPSVVVTGSLLFVLAGLLLLLPVLQTSSQEETLYKSVCEQYCAPVSDELYGRLSGAAAEKTEQLAALQQDQSAAALAEREQLSAERSSLTRLSERLEILLQRSDSRNLYLSYDAGWSALFSTGFAEWALIFCIITLCSGLFAKERSQNTWVLIRTMPRQKEAIRWKIETAAAVGTLLSISFIAVKIVLLIMVYGLPNGSAGIGSVLPERSSEISCYAAAILFFIGQTLGMMMFAVVTAFWSAQSVSAFSALVKSIGTAVVSYGIYQIPSPVKYGMVWWDAIAPSATLMDDWMPIMLAAVLLSVLFIHMIGRLALHNG